MKCPNSYNNLFKPIFFMEVILCDVLFIYGCHSIINRICDYFKWLWTIGYRPKDSGKVMFSEGHKVWPKHEATSLAFECSPRSINSVTMHYFQIDRMLTIGNLIFWILRTRCSIIRLTLVSIRRSFSNRTRIKNLKNTSLYSKNKTSVCQT